MPRMTDEELRQEIENLARQQEHALTPCDPIDYGRRFARETFERRMKIPEKEEKLNVQDAEEEPLQEA